MVFLCPLTQRGDTLDLIWPWYGPDIARECWPELPIRECQPGTPALLAAAAHHLWPCRRTEHATESGDSAFSGYRGGCLIRKAPWRGGAHRRVAGGGRNTGTQ